METLETVKAVLEIASHYPNPIIAAVSAAGAVVIGAFIMRKKEKSKLRKKGLLKDK